MNMQIILIIQARMQSMRLPGKVLKEVEGKPLLHYLLDRLKKVRRADRIIVATGEGAANMPIVELCQTLGVDCYPGSEEDVLARFYTSIKAQRADIAVRITADCPLIDPLLIDKVIEHYISNYPKYDYVSNTLERTYPRGMDVEVFSFESLEVAFKEAIDPYEREHVTPFIYRHPQRFSLSNVAGSSDNSKYRLTVDTLEDFLLISNIIQKLYPQNPDFTLDDILSLLNSQPHLAKINAHIEQTS